MNNRIDMIKHRLEQNLEPQHLQIIDDSAAHRGHAGAASGGGHFKVLIISNKFKDQPLLQRHRLVYQALQDMLEKDIHAISIRALTPEENQTSQ